MCVSFLKRLDLDAESEKGRFVSVCLIPNRMALSGVAAEIRCYWDGRTGEDVCWWGMILL